MFVCLSVTQVVSVLAVCVTHALDSVSVLLESLVQTATSAFLRPSALTQSSAVRIVLVILTEFATTYTTVTSPPASAGTAMSHLLSTSAVCPASNSYVSTSLSSIVLSSPVQFSPVLSSLVLFSLAVNCQYCFRQWFSSWVSWWHSG